MKHELRMVIIILAMFVITQFIGIYVVYSDPFHISQEVNGTIQQVSNPVLSWMDNSQVIQPSDYSAYFGSMVFSFIFSIALLFLLIKFKVKFVLKSWFLLVIVFSLFLSFTALLPEKTFFAFPLVIALTLAFLKMFQRNILIHNLTELLIYPGIATVFVSLLNFWSVICLLILISIYDMWAVWHSGIMQKMAKYQMNELKVFGGFFVPYVSKKLKEQLKKLRKLKKSERKKKKIKANIAILGGGDIFYPLLTAGVILRLKQVALPFGLPAFIGGFIPSLFVIAGATLGLSLLFLYSEKKKFYPAMPFITAGIFLGIILSYLFVSL